MAIWQPMDVPLKLEVSGVPASGYVLKAYLPETTTATSIAITKDGGSLQSTITYNSAGVLEVSSNPVIPYIDRLHKWAIFENATDATNNSNPYIGFFDNVPVSSDQIGRPAVVDGTSSSRDLADADEYKVTQFLTDTAFTLTIPEDDITIENAEFYISNPQYQSDGSTVKTTNITLAAENANVILDFKDGLSSVMSPGTVVTIKRVRDTNRYFIWGCFS